MARPTKYTRRLADSICSRLACGESMRTIASDVKMPSMSTLFLWLRKHDEFSEQYAKAKRESADALFEDIIDIVDNQSSSPVLVDGVPLIIDGKPVMTATPASVSHARLRMDARKWCASKLEPKKYGDKPDESITDEPDALSISFDVNPAASDVKVTHGKA